MVQFHLFLPSRTLIEVVFHILVFTFQLNKYTNNPLSLFVLLLCLAHFAFSCVLITTIPTVFFCFVFFFL